MFGIAKNFEQSNNTEMRLETMGNTFSYCR